MTDPKAPKVMRQWTNENGVRCFELEGHGDEIFIVADDLAKFICHVPIAEIDDPVRQQAIREFRARVVTMPPAVAYREAVHLLESFGTSLPESFRTMRPRPVRNGGAS